MLFSLWRFVWSLVLVGSCLTTSIPPSPLKKRLCDADYVFKFRVVSGPKTDCADAPSLTPLPTTETSTKGTSLGDTNRTRTNVTIVTPVSSSPSSARGNYSRSTKSLSLPQPTVNLTVPTNVNSTNEPSQAVRINATVHQATSSSRVSLPVTSSPSSSHGTDVPTPQNGTKVSRRSVRCNTRASTYQNIQIIKQNIYKGSEGLKQMDIVKVIDGKHYHESRIVPDLNFHKPLKLNGSYLYVGRQIPNVSVKNHIFLSNPYTVEPWTKVRDQLKEFDFDKDCRS